MSINTDNNCDKNFNAGCKSRFKDHLIAGAVVIVLIICSAVILNALNKPDNSKRWEPIIGDQDPSEAVFCEVVFPPKLCELTSGRTPEELIALDGDSYLDDDGNAVQVITYQDVDDGFYTYYLEAVTTDYYVQVMDVNGSRLNITDSKSSDFLSIEKQSPITTIYQYYAFIRELDSDYTISINGKTIALSQF